MRFMNKVWHPNVSSANGAICLDILKEQVRVGLSQIQTLFTAPL
jgi:ubiquitin-conjugating enzyme (huntingtin interacting protein 2)